MTVEELIVLAIEKKLIITARYRGYERAMCPHLIGYKNGHVNALFFQFGGGSRHGLKSGGQWRCLNISELSDVSTSEGPWHTDSSYPGPQSCVDEVIARV